MAGFANFVFVYCCCNN